MKFYKYHGAGNDFVLLDGFKQENELSTELIKLLCHRRLGIGSDGLILVSESDKADFKMEFYNPDGTGGMLCGNGSRCAMLFAATQGYVSDEMEFEGPDGLHKGTLHNSSILSLEIKDINEVNEICGGYFMNSGTVHLVKFVNSALKDLEVDIEGRKLRYDEQLQPAGANINFVEHLSDNNYNIRTYERGVEKETLTCGTGIVAAAVAAHLHEKEAAGNFNYEFHSRICPLQVSFQACDDGSYKNIWLKGPAQRVYEGELDLSAFSPFIGKNLPYIED